MVVDTAPRPKQAPKPRPARFTLGSNEGRPEFRPTDANRQMVTVFRSVGVPPAEIAHQLNIDEKTLRKHFAVEMAHGKALIISQIAGRVVRKALAGDNQMMVFYLKNHGGEAWRDKQRHEHTGADGTPLQPPNLVVSFLHPKQDEPTK